MSETVGITAEHLKVGALTFLLVGSIGYVGYLTSRSPRSAPPPVAAAPAPQGHHEFGINDYGKPVVLYCDSLDPQQRQAVLHVQPSRSSDDLVIAAQRGGKTIEAARLQIGPPNSDVSIQDWNKAGAHYGERIGIDEYQSATGATRNLGTVASILVQAESQKQIDVTATCS